MQPVRGTADLLPDLMAKHRFVVETARTTTARYGFQEMATPIFEFSEVFTRPLGESSDIVTKENYSFVDRGGERITLRPENTAGVVRAMISGGLTQSLPLRYFYSGPMFRYERPQKGRMRQFHQVGIEYLGPTDALADADVISAGARFLSQLGVLHNCVLHLNSLGDTESRAKYRAKLVDFLTLHENELSEHSKKRLFVNPLRILDSKEEKDQEILLGAPKLEDYLNDNSKAHFAAVTRTLDAAGVKWIYDPLLVRGLDYYCHTAFEFVTDALGAQGTVLGGGRYDGLSEMLGGQMVAGVGWAAGVERLAMMIHEVLPAVPKVTVLAVDLDANLAAFMVAEKLRDSGIDTTFPTIGTIGRKLKKAVRSNVELAIIVGSNEISKNIVQLRNLSDGTQSEIVLENLVSVVSENLSEN